MAERRMFAKTIIDSDAFVDMPLTAQALYFHLSMRADDDGFVNNPKKIQRMIGCADDDIRILIAKLFVIPFESGVCVIKHWKIHNYIQSDRYKDTLYQDEKRLLSTEENKAYTLLNDGCIQNGYNLDTQVRLGKDRLELGEGILSSSSDEDSIACENVLDLFNNICVSLPKVRSLTDTRRKRIKTASKAIQDIGSFEALFRMVEQSDFLAGRAGAWQCSFDWILKPANLTKIIEGNYSNRTDNSDFSNPNEYQNLSMDV